MPLKKLTLIQKKQAIEEIRQEVLALTKSPLYKDRLKNGALPVVGEGSLNTKVVFIGEAPGKKEAECGRPFVGAAGKVLSALLQSIGLDRADVYITNVVNDRPPENRDPTPKEVALYSPFQVRQLAIIRPRIIVTLGRHPLQFMCALLGIDVQPIGSVHGKPLKGHLSYGEVMLVPLYHPAAAFYNGSLKKAMEKDIKILKKYL